MRTRSLTGALLLSLFGVFACATTRAPPDTPGEAEPDRAPRCDSHSGVTLQVLGSGGPMLQPGRASTSYVLWVDGEARALIDLGGGSMLRIAEAGVAFETLDVIALTHLHADHAGELPALVKASYFSARERPLVIVGPGAGEGYPGLGAFLQALFGDEGAFRYLGWVLRAGEGRYHLDVREVSLETSETRDVELPLVLSLRARGATHGPVPALAYRVKTPAGDVVFAGDQTLQRGDPEFAEFAREAMVLVVHHAIPEDAEGVAAGLHARPSELGAAAAAADVYLLVLGHNMDRALARVDQGMASIRREFAGEVMVARDLECVTFAYP